MYTVYLSNFGYPLTPSHETLEKAVEHAKRANFESVIQKLSSDWKCGYEVVAIYSPISGMKYLSGVVK